MSARSRHLTRRVFFVRRAEYLASLCAIGFASAASAQVDAANAAPNQWFTGSLEAPSPALPKAGMLAIEPYFIFQSTAGVFDDDGTHQSTSDHTSTIESVVAMKYALTDRLSIQTLPSISHSWADERPSVGTKFGDLPVELEYRIIDGDYRSGTPSVTFVLGLTAPIGDYDRLNSPLDGVGGGAWLLKQEVVVQSLFDTWGNNPVRLRAWAEAFEPLNDPSVSNISAYGTEEGFRGSAAPGTAGQVGLAGGYALDQRWVLALDLVYSFNNSFRLRGTDAANEYVDFRSATSNNFALAPAIEYNWSGKAGLIFGVEFTAAGRNTPSFIAPQVAVSVLF